MFIHVVDGKAEKVDVKRFIRTRKNMSFPKRPSLTLLAEYNIFPVGVTEIPEIDIDTQKITRTGFKQIDGKWFEELSIEQLPIEIAKANILYKRDKLLTKIEKLQLKVLQEERQNEKPSFDIKGLDLIAKKLENLEDEEGFPYSIKFPALLETRIQSTGTHVGEM